MSRFFIGRPSRPTILACIALAAALGGQNAYAAATNFLLNTRNTASATTILNGSAVAGKALQVTNTNTATGATALGLTVAPGQAPLTVNSDTEVTHLNADKLDGINSSGFVQGTGLVYTQVVNIRVGDPDFTAIIAPGFASVDMSCSAGAPPSATVVLRALTASGFTVFYNQGSANQFLGSGFPSISFQSGTGNLVSVSLQGANGVPTVTNVTIGLVGRGASTCHFQIQAITTRASP